MPTISQLKSIFRINRKQNQQLFQIWVSTIPSRFFHTQGFLKTNFNKLRLGQINKHTKYIFERFNSDVVQTLKNKQKQLAATKIQKMFKDKSKIKKIKNVFGTVLSQIRNHKFPPTNMQNLHKQISHMYTMKHLDRTKSVTLTLT